MHYKPKQQPQQNQSKVQETKYLEIGDEVDLEEEEEEDLEDEKIPEEDILKDNHPMENFNVGLVIK